ncbi:MAG: MOSC domain-containing protein [Chitinophagales bacterium]
MTFKITELYVYPIKSLGGISLQTSKLTPKGLEYDRRWLLTDSNGQFITQRNMPSLVFFKTALAQNGIVVSHKNSDKDLFVPARSADAKDRRMKVVIWDDVVNAVVESEEINDWFSKLMGFEVYLVFIPDGERRVVHNHPDAEINFPDAAPYLFLSQTALDYLNGQLEQKIPINRFRANVIFEGGSPHIEDNWQTFKIGEAEFEAIKNCGRCQVITTNQETAEVGKEPLRTLATYRKEGQRILFGRYFKLKGKQHFEVKIGDEVEVLGS